MKRTCVATPSLRNRGTKVAHYHPVRKARPTERDPALSKDLIRLMHALFLPATEACEDAPWRPAMDVYRVGGGWFVKFELAGVRPEDIDLEVLGKRMTLRGVRRDVTPKEECRCFQMEIAYSR